MVVKMVVSEIRDYACLEFQTCNPVLLHADRTDFHEAVFTAGIDHLCKQRVDGQRI